MIIMNFKIICGFYSCAYGVIIGQQEPQLDIILKVPFAMAVIKNLFETER